MPSSAAAQPGSISRSDISSRKVAIRSLALLRPSKNIQRRVRSSSLSVLQQLVPAADGRARRHRNRCVRIRRPSCLGQRGHAVRSLPAKAANEIRRIDHAHDLVRASSAVPVDSFSTPSMTLATRTELSPSCQQRLPWFQHAAPANAVERLICWNPSAAQMARLHNGCHNSSFPPINRTDHFQQWQSRRAQVIRPAMVWLSLPPVLFVCSW
ncbi:MAG: hypothetical protein R3D83_02905 [Caenibius sp.]